MEGIGKIQNKSVKTAVHLQDSIHPETVTRQTPERGQNAATDRVVFQRTSQVKKQAEELFGKFLNRLEQVYPELHIVISDGKTGGDSSLLSQALTDMGDGYALLLSRDFMENLDADEGVYRLRAQAVLEAVRRLARYQNGAAVWMGEDAAVFLTRQPDNQKDTCDWIREWSRRQEQHLSDMLPSPAEQELMKSRTLGSAYHHTAAAYSQLARAKTKTAVQSVASDIRQNISSLKLTAAYGDDQLRLKAKKAIKVLEKLLLRANKKARRFDDERLTDARRKRAQENRQKEKEMQAALELKRKKTSRAAGDGAILTEGRLTNVRIPGYQNREEEERLKKMYGSSSSDWMTFTPVSPMADPGLTAAVSDLVLGGISVPEGFQIADVMDF